MTLEVFLLYLVSQFSILINLAKNRILSLHSVTRSEERRDKCEHASLHNMKEINSNCKLENEGKPG